MYISQCLIFFIGEESGLPRCYSKALDYLISFSFYLVSRSFHPCGNLSGSIFHCEFSATVFLFSFHASILKKYSYRRDSYMATPSGLPIIMGNQDAELSGFSACFFLRHWKQTWQANARAPCFCASFPRKLILTFPPHHTICLFIPSVTSIVMERDKPGKYRAATKNL